jgi:hypothetical protein
MTLVAVRVNQTVIAVHMARETLYRHVRSGQAEVGRAMVECRIVPVRGRMALAAIVTVIAGYVIGARRRLELRGVALVTVGIDQGIIVVHMTRRALDRKMRAGEVEVGRAVVECRKIGRAHV